MTKYRGSNGDGGAASIYPCQLCHGNEGFNGASRLWMTEECAAWLAIQKRGRKPIVVEACDGFFRIVKRHNLLDVESNVMAALLFTMKLLEWNCQGLGSPWKFEY
ncbi:UNVERIFIED_CONTAM: hypothetical protein Slati_0927300 [Sesamum latifolium]|uniref:Uncharacterized protein n=1 Tax=Sesamum latifolium TaxID=2727402 RepID=A0AAW2XT09_9LAMI